MINMVTGNFYLSLSVTVKATFSKRQFCSRDSFPVLMVSKAAPLCIE